MAKIRVEQLAKELKSTLAPIYVVSGDEHLVVQECCDDIRAAAKAAGYTDRELYHADNNFDWSQLTYSSQSLSLFSNQKLIEVRLTGKLSDKGRKELVAYSESPPNDAILLLVAPKFDRNVQNAKWFKALESASAYLQIWPVNGAQLPRWINTRAKKLGLQIDNEALDILVSRVEGNLLAAAQELEKLALISEDNRISAKLMSHAATDSARYDVYSLIDKALHGDARSAVKNLSGLKSDGTDILAILWALTREIRTLIQLQEAIDSGKNFASAARQSGIWDSRQSLIKGALSRLRLKQLHTLLRKASQVDKSAKGMHGADPWEGCLEIVLNLAGVNALNPLSEKIALRN
ncbi:DNA polymerase III subunit delta [Aurantivibrio infirmus]